MLFRTSLYDLRLTLRHAGRAKAFYASAVLTLALGIAGATVMFTLVRGILLRPLPVPDEDRLVVSWRVPRSGLATHVPYRSADVEEIGRASRSFEKVTGVGYNGAFEQDWRLGDVWITAKTVAVMGGFFDVAGVRPQIGRALTVEDDRRGAERLVVLSHGAWVRLFAAAPNSHRADAAPAEPRLHCGRGHARRLRVPGRIRDLDDAQRPGRHRPERGVPHRHTARRRDPGTSAPRYHRRAGDRRARRDDGGPRCSDARGRLHQLSSGGSSLQGHGRRRHRHRARRALCGRRPHPGDRRCQRRQPALDARRRSADRTRRAGRARCQPQQAGRPAPRREPRGRARRSRRRSRAGALGPADRRDARARRPAAPGIHPHRRRRRGFHNGFAFLCGGAGWCGAGADRVAARSRRLPARRRTRHDGCGERARAPAAGGRAGGAGRDRCGGRGSSRRSVQRLQTVDMGLAADRLVLAEFDLPRERYADTALRRTFHDEVVARVGAAPASSRSRHSTFSLSPAPQGGICRGSPPRDRRPTRSPSIPRSTSRPSTRPISRRSAW